MTLYNGWPPFYGTRTIAVLTNINQLYLLFGAIAIFFGFLLVLPGVRGRERISFLLRWSLALLIGASIQGCLQGAFWHYGSVQSHMRFNMANDRPTQFNIGLMIGLQHFNVSLFAMDDITNIKMNERFYLQQTDMQLNMGLQKGLPFPILKVAEYFSLNRFNSQWRWGRQYWQAGHYSFYLLWTAFITWGLSIILLQMVLYYGGVCLAMTGVLMILANLSFVSSISFGVISIRVGHDDPPSLLTPTFGWCFWLCLLMGLLCLSFGIVTVVLESQGSVLIYRFFGFENGKEGEAENNSRYINERYSEVSSSTDSNGNINPTFIYENEIESSTPHRHSVRISVEDIPLDVMKENQSFSSLDGVDFKGPRKRSKHSVTFSDYEENEQVVPDQSLPSLGNSKGIELVGKIQAESMKNHHDTLQVPPGENL